MVSTFSSPRLDMMFGLNNPMRRFFRYFHSIDIATVHNPILVSLWPGFIIISNSKAVIASPESQNRRAFLICSQDLEYALSIW